MTAFRWIFGLPAAAAITVILFALMAALIAQDPRLDSPKDILKIDILAKFAEPAPRPERIRKIDPKDLPPPPDTRWKKPDGQTVPFDPPKPDAGGRHPIDPVGVVTPIIRFAPAYPEACRARGAEGVVLVQFDVTDRGEVTNARVISSDHRCLDRTVIKTVSGWKYPPQARRGVTERFVFTLTE